MKKSILLLLLAFCSFFNLFAGPVKLESSPENVMIFDEFGRNVPAATELELSWTVFSKTGKASFSTVYGNFELEESSAVTVGSDDFETYLNLLNGTIHINNTSNYEIIVYTPVSKISVEPKTELIAVSTATEEDFSVLSGHISVYDSITGLTTLLPLPEEKPVEIAQVVKEPEELKEEITIEPVVSEEVSQPKEEPVVVSEPVLTTVGNGFNYGFKAHILVPKLNMDLLSEKNASRVRRSLENLDYSLGLNFSYNSLMFGLRLDPVNTKELDLDSYLAFIRLAGSTIDHVNYGSKGTVFHVRADRETDIDFVHPMFGQMNHKVAENRELSLFTEVKTDHFEMMAFADNLSLRDHEKENAGLRLSSKPSDSSSFKAGLSILATNNFKDFSEFLAFPGMDISFNVFQNSKLKSQLSLLGSLSLEDTNNFVIGSELNFDTEIVNATAGVAVSKGAYMSQVVDYNNDAYEIYKLGAKDPIVNIYAKANFKYENYFGSVCANLPFDFESGTKLNDKIDRDFSLEGGTTLGKTGLWIAGKFTNPKSVEKLSIGADFDFDFAMLSFELGYDEDMENPIFITTCLSLNVDRKMITD